MKTICRGNSAVAVLLLIATGVWAQETPRPIIPGNDQQSRQQEEARERERTVTAPGVRSSVMASAGYPALPSETPCFRIDRFALDVPDALSASLQSRRVSPDELARAFSRVLGRHVRAEVVDRRTWETLFRAQGMKHPAPRMRMLDGFNEGWIDFESRPDEILRGRVALDSVLSELVSRTV